MNTEEKVSIGVRAFRDKKAESVIVLDLRDLSSITDYFIICSGKSTTQVGALAEAIDEEYALRGISLLHREGLVESGWILLDYGDVIAHIFMEEIRNYYALEHLWGDAPIFNI